MTNIAVLIEYCAPAGIEQGRVFENGQRCLDRICADATILENGGSCA